MRLFIVYAYVVIYFVDSVVYNLLEFTQSYKAVFGKVAFVEGLVLQFQNLCARSLLINYLYI